ncbi:MAG: cytochrome b/b6 domain-containing protein [Betaproteobacteria bacterium]
MTPLVERLSSPLHLLLVPACLWLVASSPWIALYAEVAADATWIDRGHVWIGLATLPAGLLYLASCAQGGLWRTYYPWLAGEFGGLGRDLAGLVRLRRPMSEGGGLFSTIEGLLLLALLAVAGTGVAWFVLQSSDAAVALRAVHIIAAQMFAGLLAAHVVAVALHLVDLFGN